MKRIVFAFVLMLLLIFSIMTVNATDTYVTISFEDFGIRESEDCDFPNQLGFIVKKTKVKIKSDDTIASVTLKILKKKGIDAYYSGIAQLGGGFYLESIDNFTTYNGTKINDGYGLGEFSAGKDSGWMISYNGAFIDKSASEFTVKNGDNIKWQFTASGLGADLKKKTTSATITTTKATSEKTTVIKNTENDTSNTVASSEASTSTTEERKTESETEKTTNTSSTTVVNSSNNPSTEITTTDNSVKENKFRSLSKDEDNIVLYIIFIIAGAVAVAIVICIIILYKDKKNKEEK